MNNFGYGGKVLDRLIWIICMSLQMMQLLGSSIMNNCHNPSPGLTTKASAYKGANQEGSLGVTIHAPRNVGKCEGMNIHIPK
jgi:hypothetical protein